MPILLLCTLLAVVLPLWTIFGIFRNYQRARRMGLPILISPTDPFNPVWVLLRPYLNPLFARLPFGLGSFTEYNYHGFSWRNQGALHRRYGGAFVIVNPSENLVFVGDQAAGEFICKHSRDWQKNPAFNKILNTFGSNIGTTEGDDWQRQRKVLTAAFNEKNNRLVWEEALKQSKQMLRKWVAQSARSRNDGVDSVTEDVSLLGLHVLTGAAFGISYDFDGALTNIEAGHGMSYRDALNGVLGNLILTHLMATFQNIPVFLLPINMKRVQRSIGEFKAYMAELVERERTAYREGERAVNANLMSSIIRASEDQVGREFDLEALKRDVADKTARGSLSDAELWGNLFTFNFAGRDTTAGTLSYAIGLLACHPDWQEWLREELVNVFGKEGEISPQQYQEVFPRLVRCQAIMVCDPTPLHTSIADD
jgi:cytochrome P450